MIELEQESALARFESQIQSVTQPGGLAKAAAAAAAFAFPELDETHVLAAVDGLSLRVLGLARGKSREGLLASLNYVLFVEEGFETIGLDRCRPCHAMIHLGLQTKKASPRTIALMFHLVAERVGLATTPVLAEGKLLVAVEADDCHLLIDPSHGGAMVAQLPALPHATKLGPHRSRSGERASSDSLLWLDLMLRELASLFEQLGAAEDHRVILMMKQRVGRYSGGRLGIPTEEF